MSAYRFCRTDDIPLLVGAWNSCCQPHVPSLPALTITDFKQEIRELDLWCSSCMVGIESDDPVAVLIGCKRPPDTLVRGLAVHPDHLRRGHGRHLLTSLSAKLSILGPPRLVAEIPASNASACALFEACAWSRDRTYADHILDGGAATSVRYGAFTDVSIDDLPEAIPADASQPLWECSRTTLEKRRERLMGLALISAERIEAGALYTREGGHLSIWASQARSDPEGDATLGVLVRELERREKARAIVRGSVRARIAGFRATREIVRFTSTATPA